MDLIERVRSIEQRFWQKVDRRGPDECWEYQGYRREGYGHVRIPNRASKLGSHVVAFILANGFKPEMTCHTCDNPPCCNPKHLVAGDAASNMLDMVKRGRSSYGERNPKAVLTETQVREILADKTSTNIALGEKYGVTHSMISAIRLKKAWRHIS